MKISVLVGVIILLLAVLGGGWYYYSSHLNSLVTATNNVPPPAPEAAQTTTTTQTPGADGAEGTVIGGNVALGINRSETLGTYLIGYNGMTVYTFSKDKTASSTCYDKCAENWPPYVIGPGDNAQNVKLGVVAGKVSTITRNDGQLQVTYNGKPLYFFAGDTASGDTKGENVNKSWFVVKP